MKFPTHYYNIIYATYQIIYKLFTWFLWFKFVYFIIPKIFFETSLFKNRFKPNLKRNAFIHHLHFYPDVLSKWIVIIYFMDCQHLTGKLCQAISVARHRENFNIFDHWHLFKMYLFITATCWSLRYWKPKPLIIIQ